VAEPTLDRGLIFAARCGAPRRAAAIVMPAIVRAWATRVIATTRSSRRFAAFRLVRDWLLLADFSGPLARAVCRRQAALALRGDSSW